MKLLCLAHTRCVLCLFFLLIVSFLSESRHPLGRDELRPARSGSQSEIQKFYRTYNWPVLFERSLTHPANTIMHKRKRQKTVRTNTFSFLLPLRRLAWWRANCCSWGTGSEEEVLNLDIKSSIETIQFSWPTMPVGNILLVLAPVLRVFFLFVALYYFHNFLAFPNLCLPIDFTRSLVGFLVSAMHICLSPNNIVG